MSISLMYGIMIMLINNRKIRRDELAAHFEVSPRTVQRYVEALVDCGVPVEALPGLHGGYSIPDSYKPPSTLFTREELARLQLCIDALAPTFKDDMARSIKDKLTAVSEGKVVAPDAPRLIIDSDAWNGVGGSVQPKLDAVSAAVAGRQTIRINYTDKVGHFSRRLLDPYTLALKEGVWYVYGWCHVHNEFRLFRLARMKSIDLTDDTFVKRAGADVRAALSVDLGDRISLELEADERALAGLEEWLGADSVMEKEGGYVCRAIVGDGDELVRKIISFGPAVRVLSPDRIAERVKTEAEKIISRYGYC